MSSIDLCLCHRFVCYFLFSPIWVLKIRYVFWIPMPKCIHWHLVICFTTLAFECVVLQLPGHPIVSPQVNDSSKEGISKMLFELMVSLSYCDAFELKVVNNSNNTTQLIAFGVSSLQKLPYCYQWGHTHNNGLQKKVALPLLLRRQ